MKCSEVTIVWSISGLDGQDYGGGENLGLDGGDYGGDAGVDGLKK